MLAQRNNNKPSTTPNLSVIDDWDTPKAFDDLKNGVTPVKSFQQPQQKTLTVIDAQAWETRSYGKK